MTQLPFCLCLKWRSTIECGLRRMSLLISFAIDVEGTTKAMSRQSLSPKMYETIRAHPTTLAQFSQKLIHEGAIELAEYERRIIAYRDALDEGNAVAWDYLKEPNASLYVDWTPYLGRDWDTPVDTRFDSAQFKALSAAIDDLSSSVTVHRQVDKILKDRALMGAGELACNWGFAEMMAYATLLSEGHNVRLTGQDVGRGTFAHRHAVLHDQLTDAAILPIGSIGFVWQFRLVRLVFIRGSGACF